MFKTIKLIMKLVIKLDTDIMQICCHDDFYGETGLYSSLFCIKTSEQVLMVFYKEGRIDYFSKESKKEIEAHTYNVFDFGEQIEQQMNAKIA